MGVASLNTSHVCVVCLISKQKSPSGRGLNVVVSLGCGHSESKPVSVPDLYIPKIKERCCFLKSKKVLKDCQQFLKDVTERVSFVIFLRS